MPRGKNTNLALFCSTCNLRVTTTRLNEKTTPKAEFKPKKFCKKCRSRQELKGKEEKK